MDTRMPTFPLHFTRPQKRCFAVALALSLLQFTAAPSVTPTSSKHLPAIIEANATGSFSKNEKKVTSSKHLSAEANHAPSDIQISNTVFQIEGTGAVNVGVLRAIDPDAEDTHAFRLVQGGEHNDLFEIQASVLRFKNHNYRPAQQLNIRVEATDGIASVTRNLTIVPDFDLPALHANWQSHTIDALDLVGYGEYLAHYANAYQQGWDITAIGNAGIAFSQTETGFEILATGQGHANSSPTISEISIRPSAPQRFYLQSLLLTMYSVTNSNVRVSGYREGTKVLVYEDSNAEAYLEFTGSSTDREDIDELVLTFHPAIETAQLVSLASLGELKY